MHPLIGALQLTKTDLRWIAMQLSPRYLQPEELLSESQERVRTPIRRFLCTDASLLHLSWYVVVMYLKIGLML